MKEMVSVIIPVYKTEQYLDRCIESVVNQTYKNLEIILVDDGSPDNCPKMCDEWAKKDSRIKVIHKKNGGVSSARNEALKFANGEFVQFVDSDDYIEKDYTEKLISEYSDDVDLAICGFTIINDNRNTIVCSVKNYLDVDLLSNKRIFLKFVLDMLFDVTVNKLFRRSLIDFSFNEKLPLGEDRVFNLDYFKNIKQKIKFADSNGYIYEYNTGSAIHKKRNNAYEILVCSLDEIYKFLIQKFGDAFCDEFYIMIGGFVNAVITIVPKQEFKSTAKMLNNNELVQTYVKNFKPAGFKERLRYYLIKRKHYKMLAFLSKIKRGCIKGESKWVKKLCWFLEQGLRQLKCARLLKN